jgi:hypothetical protein
MDHKDKAMKFPDVPRYDAMPPGWKEIRGATTAPSGYVWIWNGKSIFSKEYRHALLKV